MNPVALQGAREMSCCLSVEHQETLKDSGNLKKAADCFHLITHESFMHRYHLIYTHSSFSFLCHNVIPWTIPLWFCALLLAWTLIY